MIVATVNLPNPDRTVLVIVIEKDNFDRMKRGDPITLESRELGGVIMPNIRHPNNLSLLVAYEEDQPELLKIAKSGDMLALLKYLERGRKWDPKMDGPENMVDLKGGQV